MGLLETAQKKLEQEQRRKKSLAKLRSEKKGLQARLEEVMHSKEKMPSKKRKKRKGSLLRKALQVLYKEGKIAPRADRHEQSEPKSQDMATSFSDKQTSESLAASSLPLPPSQQTTESLASAIEGLQKVISQFMAPYANPEIIKKLIQSTSQENFDQSERLKDEQKIPPSLTKEQQTFDQSERLKDEQKIPPSPTKEQQVFDESERLKDEQKIPPSLTKEQQTFDESERLKDEQKIPPSPTKEQQTFDESERLKDEQKIPPSPTKEQQTFDESERLKDEQKIPPSPTKEQQTFDESERLKDEQKIPPSLTKEQQTFDESERLKDEQDASKAYEKFVDSLSHLESGDFKPKQTSAEMEKLASAFDKKLASLHDQAMQPFPQTPSYFQPPFSPQGFLSRAQDIQPPQPLGYNPAFARPETLPPETPSKPPEPLKDLSPHKPMLEEPEATSPQQPVHEKSSQAESIGEKSQDITSAPFSQPQEFFPPPVQEIKGVLELKTPELEDSPYLTLTYDFRKIPHSFVLAKDHNILEYAYYKYKPMLIKAQNFIKRKQIAHGLNYYRTITDQQIPNELKTMIEKNIEDINDFLYKYLTAGVDDNF